MHPADIQALLKKQDATQASIAETLKTSEASVSMTISGNIRSKGIAEEISKVTGLSIHKLWPGKYKQEQHHE